MIHAAPPPEAPPFVQVETAGDRTPLAMLGFFAFGSEADLERLGNAARRAGLPANLVERRERESEWGVFFRPGADRAAATGLYRRARAGEFGTLRVRPIVILIEDLADGIDVASEVHTMDAADVGEPHR